MTPSIAEWLCGSTAAAALLDLTGKDPSSLAAAKTLRKRFSAEETAALLDTVKLRERARLKFRAADRMFFTRVGLEQSTDERVAAYKAQRFRGRVVDVCCGIGGDLQAIAARGEAVGIDRDPAVATLAAANLLACGLPGEVLAEEAHTHAIANADAWHADPDRRATGARSSRVEEHSPPLATLDAWQAVSPDAAIKLAPAATPPAHWESDRELEWISSRGECRQLVAWSGGLAQRPGRRVATAVRADGTTATFDGAANAEIEIAGAARAYIAEPDPAVLAARLDGALASATGMQRLTRDAAYYTSDRPPAHGLMATFEVLDQLPLRVRTLSDYLHERSIGVVEIKHRGIVLSPEKLRQQLRLCGEGHATLIATTLGRKAVVLIARRCAERPA